MAKRLRCPKCATVVEVEGSWKPVCGNCGFGAEPGPDAKSQVGAPVQFEPLGSMRAGFCAFCGGSLPRKEGGEPPQGWQEAPAPTWPMAPAASVGYNKVGLYTLIAILAAFVGWLIAEGGF